MDVGSKGEGVNGRAVPYTHGCESEGNGVNGRAVSDTDGRGK